LPFTARESDRTERDPASDETACWTACFSEQPPLVHGTTGDLPAPFVDVQEVRLIGVEDRGFGVARLVRAMGVRHALG